jgi:hypothetical protein
MLSYICSGVSFKDVHSFFRDKMNIIGIIVLVIGVIITIVGGAGFVIAAFEESAWWGLGVLFFPVISPVFLILHFGDAWRPALKFVTGFVLVLLGTLLRFIAQP